MAAGGVLFSPHALALLVGQRFVLTVSSHLRATGPAVPTDCPPGTRRQASGGLLTLRCTTSGYLYIAEQPGTTTLSAAVRPHCLPGREHMPAVGDHSEPEDHGHVTEQPTGIP